MKELLLEISKYTICCPYLELGPRPVLTVDIGSSIVIIGQAPSSIVHVTGTPWNDKSGNR